AGRGSDWQRGKTYLHAFESNRGRPAVARGDTASADEPEYGPHAALYERVLDAMYGDGDTVSGAQAVRELSREPTHAGAVANADLCATTLWRASRHDFVGVPNAI